jgi:hypothetical protein
MGSPLHSLSWFFRMFPIVLSQVVPSGWAHKRFNRCTEGSQSSPDWSPESSRKCLQGRLQSGPKGDAYCGVMSSDQGPAESPGRVPLAFPPAWLPSGAPNGVPRGSQRVFLRRSLGLPKTFSQWVHQRCPRWGGPGAPRVGSPVGCPVFPRSGLFGPRELPRGARMVPVGVHVGFPREPLGSSPRDSPTGSTLVTPGGPLAWHP